MPAIHTVKRMMNPYAQIARFYDWENADFTEDLSFWSDLVRQRGGPVLELGCGSGRVLLHLAREGFETTGVDSSPEMIALARRRLEKQPAIAGRIQLLEADFRRLDLKKTYPLVIAPFNTFSHLTETADAGAALATIAAHLAPGGIVALALPNPIPIYSALPEGLVLERTFHDGERGATVQQFSSLRVNRVAQLGHITWIYDEIDPAGKVTRTTVPMTLRYFFPNEIPLLLERTGLQLHHLWGDYDRSPFAEDSPVLIAIGGRAG
jgi:SAM-dependent methyltransferase